MCTGGHEDIARTVSFWSKCILEVNKDGNFILADTRINGLDKFDNPFENILR